MTEADDTDGGADKSAETHDWLVDASTDVADVTTYYDDWAGEYDDQLAAWDYRAPAVVAAYLRTEAPDAEVVLDAGCGTGLAGVALRRSGYEGVVHGIDVSAASLAIARTRGVYASLGPGNLQESLAIADDGYDATMCVGVMSYVPNVTECWRELCRVTRPGGVVAITQRTDWWVARNCAAVVAEMVAAGDWEIIEVTDPRPYLPDDPNHGDELQVHYVVCRVV